jgi:hypothetical protein
LPGRDRWPSQVWRERQVALAPRRQRRRFKAIASTGEWQLGAKAQFASPIADFCNKICQFRAHAPQQTGTFIRSPRRRLRAVPAEREPQCLRGSGRRVTAKRHDVPGSGTATNNSLHRRRRRCLRSAG